MANHRNLELRDTIEETIDVYCMIFIACYVALE